MPRALKRHKRKPIRTPPLARNLSINIPLLHWARIERIVPRPLQTARESRIAYVVAAKVVLANVNQCADAALKEGRDVRVRRPVVVKPGGEGEVDFHVNEGEVACEGGVDADFCTDFGTVKIGPDASACASGRCYKRGRFGVLLCDWVAEGIQDLPVTFLGNIVRVYSCDIVLKSRAYMTPPNCAHLT